MNDSFKYYAFISYNAKDTAWGKRLQKKLNCVCNGDWMWDKDLIAFAREKGYFNGACSQ